MSRHPIFVSIDGPKGSGKTTLMRRLPSLMPPALSVALYSEKEIDPFRDQTEALIEKHRGNMTADVEKEVVRLLAAGRAEITKEILSRSDADIVLIERWYLSDAYFRRCLAFRDVLNVNMELGVARPDLALATVCDPLESWRRATTRPRGLASRAGLTKEQHIAATAAFERAVDQHQATKLRTDGPADVVAMRARDLILDIAPRRA